MSSSLPKAKTAVFTFGRFQPPTIGHARLIKAILERAKELKADPYIFVSASLNDREKLLKNINKESRTTTIPKTKKQKVSSITVSDVPTTSAINVGSLVEKFPNPLHCNTKVSYLQQMFPDFPKDNIISTEQYKSLIMSVVYSLKKVAKYDRIIMIIGSDRVEGFENMFKNMASKDAYAKSVYGDIIIEGIVRDEKSKHMTTGMSGTKMRTAALEGDIQTFQQGVFGLNPKKTLGLMNEIRLAYSFPEYAPVPSQGGYRKKNIKTIKPKKQNTKRVKSTNIMDMFRDMFVVKKQKKVRRV
jgi:nicotinamide mononucleotide adenylyltransferase